MSAVSPDQLPGSVALTRVGHTRLVNQSLVILGLVTVAASIVFFAGTIVGDHGGRSLVLVPLAIGVSLILAGLTTGTAWQKASFWFSVAMVGQTLSLQLINAGYQLRYQHYKPLGELLLYPNVLFLAGALVQLLLVGIALRGVVPAIANWVRTRMRIWQLVVLALCFFLPTTTVSPSPVQYIGEFVVAGSFQLLSLATIILFAIAIPAESIQKFRTIVEGIGAEWNSGKMANGFALTAAVFVAVLGIGLNFFSYERHPHVPDEVAYLMQARFFASGAVTMPAPPVPEAFEVYLMKTDGNVWYPVTLPGWAMLLGLGTFFGAPWIVNPILAGVNVLLTFWLVTRLYSIRAAKLCIILLALSPWFIFLAMSFMTHMAALACLLVGAIGVVKARETQNLRWGLLSGAGIGFLSMIRPLEAVAVAGLLGLWILGLGGKRLGLASITAVAVGTLLLGGLGLAYNARLTGDPLKFPVNAYTDEKFGPNSNAYGFGPDRGMGWQLDPYPGHGPVDALVNSNLNISALNAELLGWSIGTFLMIGAFLCFAKYRTSDYLMLAVIAAIYVLHFFYYFSGGPDFGARYWFLMIVPLIVLTLRGVEALAERLRELGPGADTRLYGAIGALIVLTLCVFVPWRAIDKYHDFRGMKPDIRELAGKVDFGRSLVLVEGNQHPDYDSAFIYNSLDLSGDAPVFAWDRDGVTREKLLVLYADRPVWIVRSPSLTGQNYEIAAGPISAGSALAVRDE